MNKIVVICIILLIPSVSEAQQAFGQVTSARLWNDASDGGTYQPPGPLVGGGNSMADHLAGVSPFYTGSEKDCKQGSSWAVGATVHVNAWHYSDLPVQYSLGSRISISGLGTFPGGGNSHVAFWWVGAGGFHQKNYTVRYVIPGSINNVSTQGRSVSVNFELIVSAEGTGGPWSDETVSVELDVCDPTPTNTPPVLPPTDTYTPTKTNTPVDTNTPTHTFTPGGPTITPTDTATNTPLNTPTNTHTATNTPVFTPTETATPLPTSTPVPPRLDSPSLTCSVVQGYPPIVGVQLAAYNEANTAWIGLYLKWWDHVNLEYVLLETWLVSGAVAQTAQSWSFEVDYSNAAYLFEAFAIPADFTLNRISSTATCGQSVPPEPTATNTPTLTETPTPTETFTPSLITITPTLTPTNTFTSTATFTPTETATPTDTPVDTLTPTETTTPGLETNTPTYTPVPPTDTNTPTATNTPTSTATFTSTPIDTPTPPLIKTWTPTIPPDDGDPCDDPDYNLVGIRFLNGSPSIFGAFIAGIQFEEMLEFHTTFFSEVSYATGDLDTIPPDEDDAAIGKAPSNYEFLFEAEQGPGVGIFFSQEFPIDLPFMYNETYVLIGRNVDKICNERSGYVAVELHMPTWTPTHSPTPTETPVNTPTPTFTPSPRAIFLIINDENTSLDNFEEDRLWRP